jgi:hypothetical protein
MAERFEADIAAYVRMGNHDRFLLRTRRAKSFQMDSEKFVEPIKASYLPATPHKGILGPIGGSASCSA